MLKSGEKRKHLFKRGDAVVWRHWIPDHFRTGLKDKDLIEDRGVILKVFSVQRTNRLPDGRSINGLKPIEVWKAQVFFTSGKEEVLPLICLKHCGED